MEWEMFFRNYWKFYLQLEREFIELTQYIEFVPANYNVYSIKLMQLLLTIGSEVDSVMKEMCAIKDKDRPSIADYASILLVRYPQITSQKVCVFNRSLEITPFANWDKEKASQSLYFWEIYNKVKHHRAENFQLASLEVVANALSALFLLNMYNFNAIYLKKGNLMHNIPETADESKLFFRDSWTERIRTSVAKYHYRVYDDDGHIYIFDCPK